MKDETRLWCAGLPLEQEARATDAERQILQARIVDERRSAFRFSLIGFVPIVAFVTFHLLAMDLAAMLTLLLVCIAPLVLIKAFGHWSTSRRYAKDQAAGVVWRFVGSVSKHDRGATDQHHAKLVATGLMSDEPDVRQTLVILPISREVLSANDSPAPQGMRIEIAEVAEVPESALQEPLPDRLAKTKLASEGAKRRRLTGGELAELTDKIRRLRRLSAGFWILTVLTGVVFFLWRKAGYPIPPEPITQVIPAGLWLYTVCEVALNRLRAARLSRDLSLGWVVTVGPAPGAQPSSNAIDVSHEVLIASLLYWTVNGSPAVWRSSRRFCTLLIDVQG